MQSELLPQTTTPEVSKPTKRLHRQWTGVMLGLLLGVGGLIGGRLGQLYPHFDIFSQFGLQFSCICVAFIFSAFLPRFKTLWGIVLTVAMFALYGAWPHIVSDNLQNKGDFKLAAGEYALRIAHFNTYKNNFDTEAIAKELMRLDADVVTLIETNDMKKQWLFTKLKSVYPYHFDCPPEMYCDQAIMSKTPFTGAVGQEIWRGPPFVSAQLSGVFSGVTVYGLHTTRFPHSRAQLAQIRAFTNLLETVPGEKVVLGDFNATPFSRVLSTLEQGAGLRRVTNLPTWPAQWQFPQLAIDHIFVSQNFRVVGEEQIGNNAGSDHYPILMTLAYRPGR